MLELLTELQDLQFDLVNAGHTAHVDASVHENHGEPGTHISISLYIDGRHYYDFSSLDSRKRLDALLESINKLYD
jgi:hypothetical protein